MNDSYTLCHRTRIDLLEHIQIQLHILNTSANIYAHTAWQGKKEVQKNT